MAMRLPDGTRVEVLGTVPKKYQSHAGQRGRITAYCEGWYWVSMDGEPEHRGVVLHLRRREIKPLED